MKFRNKFFKSSTGQTLNLSVSKPIYSSLVIQCSGNYVRTSDANYSNNGKSNIQNYNSYQNIAFRYNA